MKTMLLSFVVLYTIATSPVQIRGKVFSKSDSEVLSGVMVVVNKTDTTYTDMDGNFVINGVDSLKRIDLQYPSHTTEGLSLVRLSDKELITKK